MNQPPPPPNVNKAQDPCTVAKHRTILAELDLPGLIPAEAPAPAAPAQTKMVTDDSHPATDETKLTQQSKHARRDQIQQLLQTEMVPLMRELFQEEVKRLPAAPIASPTRDLEQATGLQNLLVQKLKRSKTLHDAAVSAIVAKQQHVREQQSELEKLQLDHKQRSVKVEEELSQLRAKIEQVGGQAAKQGVNHVKPVLTGTLTQEALRASCAAQMVNLQSRNPALAAQASSMDVLFTGVLQQADSMVQQVQAQPQLPPQQESAPHGIPQWFGILRRAIQRSQQHNHLHRMQMRG